MEEPQRLWGRNGEAVRRGIEAGKILHINTASEEIADEFLLFRCRGCVLSKISFGPQLNGYWQIGRDARRLLKGRKLRNQIGQIIWTIITTTSAMSSVSGAPARIKSVN